MTWFATCECGRMNISGAKCVCHHAEQFDCDCTHDGNRQIIGAVCRQRIADVWIDCVTRGPVSL